MAGVVGKPHGLRGEVYVEVISDDPRRFEAGSRLVSENGSPRVVESARSHGRRMLVKFSGIETREAAEDLRGPLYVDADTARTLDEGEFWDHELVGCEVVEGRGSPAAGRVRDVIHAPAQDLLVIETPRGEKLVPVVEELISSVDVAHRLIVIEAGRGLLD